MHTDERKARAIGALIGAVVGVVLVLMGGMGALVLVGAFVGSLIGGHEWRNKHPKAPAAAQE